MEEGMAPPRIRLLPSREGLWTLFHYDAETGRLSWKERPEQASWNTRWAGKEALTALNHGYRRGLLFRRSVYAHQVIWKMMTGVDAPELDHIDGNKLNNAWKNLRAALGGANQKNSSRRRDNTSGQVGVTKRGEKWIAQIGIAKSTKHLGIFDTYEQAVAARKTGEREYGFHQNHGRDPAT